MSNVPGTSIVSSSWVVAVGVLPSGAIMPHEKMRREFSSQISDRHVAVTEGISLWTLTQASNELIRGNSRP